MVSDLKKKYLLLTVALCLSMAVFTGCGSKGKNTDTDGQMTDSPDTNDGETAPSPNTTDNSIMDDMENGVDDVIDGAEDAVDDAAGNGTQDERDNNNSVTSGKDRNDNR